MTTSNLSLYKAQFRDVKGVCEANSFERLKLWEEYQSDWVQDNTGVLLTFGYIKVGNASLPVCADLVCAMVRGRRILFFSDTSRIVDHDLIRRSIQEIVPDVPIHDAMNFHNCLRSR